MPVLTKDEEEELGNRRLVLLTLRRWSAKPPGKCLQGQGGQEGDREQSKFYEWGGWGVGEELN